MPRMCVLVIAIVLALGGCQADGSDPAEGSGNGPSPDSAAIRSGLASLFAGDHPGSRETAEGRCFAEELTAAVPPEELRSAGVLDASYDVVAEPPPLPEDVAGDWADAQLACADFVEASTRAQVKVTKGDLDGEAYAACLRQKLTDEQIRAAVAASLRGDFDAAEVAELSASQSACARRSRISAAN
jgi:hypothetical protein